MPPSIGSVSFPVKDDLLEIPEEPPRSEGVYHLYVVRIEDRDRVRRELERVGISAGLQYPVRRHLQKALANLGRKKGDFPVTERLSARCLSLPIFPEMRETQVTVVGTLAKARQA